MDEKERIKEWAQSTASHYDDVKTLLSAGWDSSVDSYFTQYDEKTDVYEYGFDDLAVLKNMLSNMWHEEYMHDVILTCAIAIFKARPRHNEIVDNQSISKENMTDDMTIPEFIYVF